MGTFARQSSTVASIAILAGFLLTAAPAEAERTSWIIEEDGSHPEVMFSFLGGWYLTGFGGEFRFAFPIVPDGAIDYLNESFAMEVGAGYQYFLDSAHNFGRLTFPVTVRWDFHLTELWTVYGALGAAGGVPFDRPHKDIFGYHGYVWPVAAVGCFLHLAPGVDFRAEAGTLGILAGVDFTVGGAEPSSEPSEPAPADPEEWGFLPGSV